MPRNDATTLAGTAPASWDALVIALVDELERREALIATILGDEPDVAAAALAKWHNTPLPTALGPVDPTTRERIVAIQVAMGEQETRLTTALAAVEQELQRVAHQNRTQPSRNVSDIHAGGFEARA